MNFQEIKVYWELIHCGLPFVTQTCLLNEILFPNVQNESIYSTEQVVWTLSDFAQIQPRFQSQFRWHVCANAIIGRQDPVIVMRRSAILTQLSFPKGSFFSRGFPPEKQRKCFIWSCAHEPQNQKETSKRDSPHYCCHCKRYSLWTNGWAIRGAAVGSPHWCAPWKEIKHQVLFKEHVAVQDAVMNFAV